MDHTVTNFYYDKVNLTLNLETGFMESERLNMNRNCTYRTSSLRKVHLSQQIFLGITDRSHAKILSRKLWNLTVRGRKLQFPEDPPRFLKLQLIRSRIPITKSARRTVTDLRLRMCVLLALLSQLLIQTIMRNFGNWKSSIWNQEQEPNYSKGQRSWSTTTTTSIPYKGSITNGHRPRP